MSSDTESDSYDIEDVEVTLPNGPAPHAPQDPGPNTQDPEESDDDVELVYLNSYLQAWQEEQDEAEWYRQAEQDHHDEDDESCQDESDHGPEEESEPQPEAVTDSEDSDETLHCHTPHWPSCATLRNSLNGRQLLRAKAKAKSSEGTSLTKTQKRRHRHNGANRTKQNKKAKLRRWKRESRAIYQLNGIPEQDFPEDIKIGHVTHQPRLSRAESASSSIEVYVPPGPTPNAQNIVHPTPKIKCVPAWCAKHQMPVPPWHLNRIV